MKVYIVSHGYDYEDSIIVGVYAEEDKAASYILNQSAEIDEDDEGTKIEYKMKEESRGSDCRYFSNNYGQYYIIKEYEVLI